MFFIPPVRPLLKGWMYSFLAFGGLAFVLIGQLVWTMSMPLEDALHMAGRDWLPWAVLTPLIFRFVSRFPLEREHWKSGLGLQIACAVATLSLCTWWAERIVPHHPPADRRPDFEFHPPAPPPPDRSFPGRSPHSGRHPPFDLFFSLGFRLPIYLAIASIAHALYFYRRAQERERRSLGLEAGLAKARLEALRMQLQPHFLFNSLNAIAELVHRDADTADAMLVALSDLLRLTLEASGEQELPLGRELEFVEHYLAIEKLRLGNRLQVEFQVPPETRNALVPVFLLQPLVENAIRHGLEKTAGAGMLKISVCCRNGLLELTIADNGKGLESALPVVEGIGLSNTRARLKELYGSTAALDLRYREGAIVEITLPFHTASHQMT